MNALYDCAFIKASAMDGLCTAFPILSKNHAEVFELEELRRKTSDTGFSFQIIGFLR